MYEVINYSFINPDAFDRIMLPDDHILRQVVKVANPLSEEQSVMRTTLYRGYLARSAAMQPGEIIICPFLNWGAIFIPSQGTLPQENLKLEA